MKIDMAGLPSVVTPFQCSSAPIAGRRSGWVSRAHERVAGLHQRAW